MRLLLRHLASHYYKVLILRLKAFPINVYFEHYVLASPLAVVGETILYARRVGPRVELQIRRLDVNSDEVRIAIWELTETGYTF